MRAFVSYKTGGIDEEYAVAIERRLEEDGYDVFRDASDLKVSETWAARLRQEIEDCDVFIPIVSNRSLESTWVVTEVRYAIECEKRIAPLLLEELSKKNRFEQYGPLLQHIQGIESQGDKVEDVDRLAQQLATGKIQPVNEPAKAKIQRPAPRRRVRFDATACAIMVLLLITGAISSWRAHTGSAPAWNELVTQSTTVSFLNALKIDLIRLLAVTVLAIYVLGDYFGIELKRILGVWRGSSWRFDSENARWKNLPLLAFRAAYLVMAIWFGLVAMQDFVNIGHKAKDLTDRHLMAQEDINSEAKYSDRVSQVYASCQWYAIYTAVFYAGIFPLLILVPWYALVSRDRRKLFKAVATWSLPEDDRSWTDEALAPMKSDLRNIAKRYIIVASVIAVFVQVEIWLGYQPRFMPESHLRLAAYGTFAFVLAFVILLVGIFESFRRRVWHHLRTSRTPLSHRLSAINHLVTPVDCVFVASLVMACVVLNVPM